MPVVKSKEIRERRQRTGLKLGEFAELTGLKYQTYANIEADCHNPSIEFVHRIAKAFTAVEGAPCKAEDLLQPTEAKAA